MLAISTLPNFKLLMEGTQLTPEASVSLLVSQEKLEMIEQQL